jgi:sterol desaturase/sphingolipid hydroxylase (fatty acid hydroxylase superfamily)
VGPLLYLIALIAFVAIFTREVIAPASGNDCDKRWQIYAGAISAFQMAVALFAGWLFQDWFQAAAFFQMPIEVPDFIAALVAFLIASFIAYWWHRACHASAFLWRTVHQLHHSPARIETLTAFYVHPFDGLAANLLNAFVAFVVLGETTEVAAYALLIAAVYNIYIHSDTRSPRWIATIIQRPEMHRVHHKSGWHRNNYGLPVWDLAFGTFENPEKADFKCGFDSKKEARIQEMLLLQEVEG